MLREQRERREFIYRKSIERERRTREDKKRKIREAVDENHEIPTTLRKEALALHKTLDYEDEGGDGVVSHIDDEYRWAGVEDPKIIVTTSRDPSSRLKQFAKEIKLMFPNSLRINRGNHGIDNLVQACNGNGVTDLIVLKETRGNPDGMVVCHLPHGPTAYFTLYNTILRHDIPNVGTMSEEFPHLLFHGFETPLAQRVRDILKYLFPVPKDESKRVVTFYQKDDYVLFRHNVYSKDVETRRIKLKEVGPRFEMFCFKILLGTIDQTDSADVEWEYAPYKRTAKKAKLFSL